MTQESNILFTFTYIMKEEASVIPQKAKGIRALHRKSRKCKDVEVWKHGLFREV